jgi:hypothetical protein
MRLAPKDSPGRSTRRARGFAVEIGLLRAQGYTLEAIREALAEAGVEVSKSTVQREVTKLASRPSSGVATAPEPLHRVAEVVSVSTGAPPSPDTDMRSAKEIAEAFTATQNTNSLFRKRSTQ